MAAEFKNGTVVGHEFKYRTSVSGAGCKRKWVRPDVEAMLLVLVFLGGCHGFQDQRFAMEPQDQSALLGSRVTLPCRVVNKYGTLQWTKDDFGLGTDRDLAGFERYRMVGSDEEGDYSLDISNVTLDDDAVFECQVSSGPQGEKAIRSRSAQLTVLVAPEPPRIIQGAFIDAIEGQSIDIECVSAGGRPAAEITWVDGNQTVIKNNVQYKVEADGKLFTARSVLRLSPTKEYHNQTITCQSQNTADRAYRMASVHIEVKYAPKLRLSLKSDSVNGKVLEGTEAVIRCDIDSNPQAQVYRWYLNDDPVIGDFTHEMIIYNVTRKHNKAKIVCEVSNSVGKSQESYVLEVTYPPSFKSKPQNVEAETGSTVTLRCDVDGHPEPEIRWLLQEPGRIGQVKGKSRNLEVLVSNDTAGRYICKAAVEGFPEIESSASILIKGPPKIISNKTQIGVEGEMVRVECAAISVPKPDDIRWYFEGREISIIRNPEYATLEELLPDGKVKSSLVIRNSKTSHYGAYNCSVTNEYGNENAVIFLKPLQTLPLFLILGGVSSATLLFSAFIALLVMCYKKRRENSKNVNEKPDVTANAADLYKDSDRSSNISDMKPQLPNSDGSYDLEYTSSETSNTKVSGGLPLAGPVGLSVRRDDPLLQFRYSNDYSDPVYNDAYFKNAALGGYLYDYQGYPPPPTLRVQSPNQIEPMGHRSQQGSLTRSIDTTSTAQLISGSVSQNNSLKRTKDDETDAINSLGLPVGGDTPPTPIYAQPNMKGLSSGIDVRYAATYGNPYLRNSGLSFSGDIHTAKPMSTPAPPPYSSIRNSVVLSTGSGNKPSQATHV